MSNSANISWNRPLNSRPPSHLTLNSIPHFRKTFLVTPATSLDVVDLPNSLHLDYPVAWCVINKYNFPMYFIRSMPISSIGINSSTAKSGITTESLGGFGLK